jgi:hypothetical protein
VKFDYQSRVRVGIVLLIAFAVLSNLELLTTWVQTDLSFIGQDDVTQFEQRFGEIKKRLPDKGVVGYANSYESDLRQFFLTQYTLTPRVLSLEPGLPLYVRHVRTDTTSSQFNDGEFSVAEYEEGMKVFDFHNGIQLVKMGSK